MKRLLLILLLCLSLVSSISFAEPVIEIAGGISYFHQLKYDNYWYQEPFPYTRDETGRAWRIGVRNRINDRWSWSASWLDLGRNSVVSQYVTDADYDADSHRCLRGCDVPVTGTTTSSARGPEFAAIYDLTPFYLRGGIFIWLTKLGTTVVAHEKFDNFTFTYNERGFLTAPFAGIGVRYKWAFAEITYYHGLGGGGYPLAKRATVPMAGVQIPFK